MSIQFVLRCCFLIKKTRPARCVLFTLSPRSTVQDGFDGRNKQCLSLQSRHANPTEAIIRSRTFWCSQRHGLAVALLHRITSGFTHALPPFSLYVRLLTSPRGYPLHACTSYRCRSRNVFIHDKALFVGSRTQKLDLGETLDASKQPKLIVVDITSEM